MNGKAPWEEAIRGAVQYMGGKLGAVEQEERKILNKAPNADHRTAEAPEVIFPILEKKKVKFREIG